MTQLHERQVPSVARTGPSSPAPRRRRTPSRALPYLLIAPALLVLLAVLGYPLVRLVVMSLQHFGLRQQFGAPPDFVGLANFRTVLSDPYLWTVVGRTVAFCATSVVLTMTIGLAIATLMDRLSRGWRLLVQVGLLLAWAMPALTATVVWQWVFDTQFGLANWLLTSAHLGDFRDHSWLSDPRSFFAVATVVVVWMGVPFVAFTLYAGLTQVPREMVEAAEVDGAGEWQRFRSVVLPMLKPVLLILTALSVLWDFRVFTQVYVLQQAGGIAKDTNLLGVYAYRISIGGNRFDLGAAVALVMVAITLALTLVYLRQMVATEEL